MPSPAAEPPSLILDVPKTSPVTSYHSACFSRVLFAPKTPPSTLRIAVLKKQSNHFSAYFFSVRKHPHPVSLPKGARKTTGVHCQGHAHCARGGLEGGDVKTRETPAARTFDCFGLMCVFRFPPRLQTAGLSQIPFLFSAFQ